MQIGTNEQRYTDSKLQSIIIFKCMYTHVDIHTHSEYLQSSLTVYKHEKNTQDGLTCYLAL